LSPIVIGIVPDQGGGVVYSLTNDGQVYSTWSSNIEVKSGKYSPVSIEALSKEDVVGFNLVTILQSFLTSPDVSEEDRTIVMKRMIREMTQSAP
ncbi:hypothetical protein, partial [Pseudomonas viridiflava]|uniref:hypothetical protein n=1 Tax=Pseudomonas viridiflava TaxID=33069 RepID=UPI00197CECF7